MKSGIGMGVQDLVQHSRDLQRYEMCIGVLRSCRADKYGFQVNDR